ncbi:unnamed protein product [Trichobilharzia regenti]|nr:unnamed protein product [Trichobilharzia regenti]
MRFFLPRCHISGAFNICSQPIYNIRPHISILRKKVNNFSSSQLEDETRGSLVYKSPHNKLVLGAKTFSLMSSSIVFLLQPLLFTNISNPKVFGVALFGGIVFSVSTPLLLHILTRSHVTKLYYNKRSRIFTAYMKGILLNNKKLEFTAEEVKYAEPAFTMASITVRGTPLFISEEEFTDLEVYRHLVRFNEPLDVKKF